MVGKNIGTLVSFGPIVGYDYNLTTRAAGYLANNAKGTKFNDKVNQTYRCY